MEVFLLAFCLLFHPSSIRLGSYPLPFFFFKKKEKETTEKKNPEEQIKKHEN